MKRIIGVALVWVLAGSASATNVANFDNLALAPESYWNGSASPGANTFTSGIATFNNAYIIDSFSGWGFWGGWSYSNITDNTTPGYENQYSAIPGHAQSGTNYGVTYFDTYSGNVPTVALATPSVIDQVFLTNTTYPYLIMRDGDPGGFSKKFGGDSGNDLDWLLLTITGKNALGQTTGSVDFYLADYRFADNSKDYLISDWTAVDLRSLGTVKSLAFDLTGSDSGDFGLNTPAYFAMDTLVAPEPASALLLGIGGAIVALRRKRS